MKDQIKFLVLMFLLTVTFQSSAQQPGDVNGDGNTNISDVTELIHYLLVGDTSVIIVENADVDVDGLVNISDVTALIHLILSAGAAPVTETFTVEGVSFTMVNVDGGTFTMGDNSFIYNSPAHQVTLSDFSIGQTEVTQELYLAVMGINPSWFCSAEGYNDDLRRPVEEVRWYDCQDFIAKLNRLTGRTFRLPTEAEWEYAAGGGNRSKGYYFSGSDDIDEVGWYWLNIPSLEDHTEGYGTQPVGLKKPNELGLYDMTGNVSEWCQDWFDITYQSDEAQVNPTGPSEPYTSAWRVCRGGGWTTTDSFNSWRKNRSWCSAWGISTSIGFRIVLSNEE